jgi:hypothetical protein
MKFIIIGQKIMAEIFVFGSNLLGIHKKGAALHALNNHGAILGQGEGLQGTSYAIPTKETPYRRLDLIAINMYVAKFLAFAYWNSEHLFKVTQIGCGLAGYEPFQIAPLFSLAKGALHVHNVILPPEFIAILQN